jgi:hypothetical protein
MRKIQQRGDTISRAEEALQRCEEMLASIAHMIARHTELTVEAQLHTELLAEARRIWQRDLNSFEIRLLVRHAAGATSEDRPAALEGQEGVLVYKTDEVIPFSGMFIVESMHPLPRIVLLREGDPFPGCARCSEVLKFRVLARHNLPGNLETRIDKLPTIDVR